MGLSHFAIANGLPGASVVAVCDTSRYVRSVLRKYAGVQTYGEADEMVTDAQVDCLIVATPTSTHFAVAKQALQSGLHLFVEKPLTFRPRRAARWPTSRWSENGSTRWASTTVSSARSRKRAG